MKLHFKRTSIFELSAAKVLSVLAVAVLTISAIFLSSPPVRAEAASPVTLQCQVGTNSNGNTLACNGITVDGSAALNCQSPNPINVNSGVYVVVAVICSGNVEVAGTTVAEALTAPLLSIDSNSGAISAINGGTSVLTVSNLLSRVTVTNNGTVFSLTLSPLTLNAGNGGLGATASVLGIGTAQISIYGGAGSVSFANSTFTFTSTDYITANASLLGLINANAACATPVSLNLNQLFPITVPLPTCSGS
jgi:hypothetical protein